jgi:hypothetical protein
MTEPTIREARLAKITAPFVGSKAELLEEHPDCSEELSLLGSGLHSIKKLVHISPPVNGNGEVWKGLITRAENGEGSALYAPRWKGTVYRYAAIIRCSPQGAARLCSAGSGRSQIDRGISRAEETQAKSIGRKRNETEDRRADA